MTLSHAMLLSNMFLLSRISKCAVPMSQRLKNQDLPLTVPALLQTRILFPGRKQVEGDLGVLLGDPQASQEQCFLFSADRGKRLGFLCRGRRPPLDGHQVSH